MQLAAQLQAQIFGPIPVVPEGQDPAGSTEEAQARRWVSSDAYEFALHAEHTLYCDNMLIEPGIARNKALRENLFVVVVSLINKIPVNYLALSSLALAEIHRIACSHTSMSATIYKPPIIYFKSRLIQV